MSSIFYPVSLISDINIRRISRTNMDEFEDGTVNVRRMWADQQFKRRVEFTHSPLTRAEYKYLRSFYTARNGRYDSFWWRDNFNRGGNINVRFGMDLDESRINLSYPIKVALEEVAPSRPLPDAPDIKIATGSSPLCWYDANREKYYLHAGTAYEESEALYDAATQNYPLLITPNPNYPLISNDIFSQWQSYTLEPGGEFQSAANLTGLATGQPACTLFGIFKHQSNTNNVRLFGTGNHGTAAQGLSFRLHGNIYKPCVGSTSETWTTAVFTNSPVNTWRSFAIVWAASSNTATLYVNAVSIGAESVTRSLVQGPVWMGAGVNTYANHAHPMIFGAALTLAQVKALHNLFAHQYGLSTVA